MLTHVELKENVEYWAVCSDGKKRHAVFVNKYIPSGVVFCCYPLGVNIIGYELVED